MRTLGLLLMLLSGSAVAQTIEGYWQDTERRILFSTDAPPGYVYGRWTALDQAQTYPTAKQFRKSAGGYDVVDLLYDDEEVVHDQKGVHEEEKRHQLFSFCVAFRDSLKKVPSQ